jgi:hypothetical protein
VFKQSAHKKAKPKTSRPKVNGDKDFAENENDELKITA